jgi:hypothetical protein
MNHSINLKVAKWSPNIGSQKDLKAALANNKEFQTCDVVNGYDLTTTRAELLAQGFTHAQIRYGHRMEKVWYGKL